MKYYFCTPFLKNITHMNRYETVFILTPVLSDDQAKETVEKFKKFLTDNGATILHEENWGLKKLAYPIQKKTTGFYYLIEHDAPGELIANLEIQFKRDERIIRFLTVRMDRDFKAYALKRRTPAAKEEVVQ
jgi:small subunit ribosomal protein S6